MRTLSPLLCLLFVSAAGCIHTGARVGSDAASLGAGDVTGRWNVTISIDGETIDGIALLTQTGDAVSGSIGPDEQSQHPLEGVVEGDRLTITTLPRPGRTVAFDRCHLTVDGEMMSGVIERGGSVAGTIEFRRMGESSASPGDA